MVPAVPFPEILQLGFPRKAIWIKTRSPEEALTVF